LMENQPTTTVKPLPIYDSSKRGFKPWVELMEAIRYRNAIGHMVRRDVVSRYKRSFLGILWTMLHPLGYMLVIAIVFSQILNTGPKHAAYLLSGMITWTFFSQTTHAVLHGFRWGTALHKKIYVPHRVFGISAIGTGLVNLSLSLIPLMVVMLIVKVPIRWTFLYIPIPMLMLSCFSLGIGLLLGTIGINFPDVSDMYQIVLTAWFYLTPIIYPEDRLSDAVRVAIATFNPIYPLLKLFRLPTYYGSIPTWEEFLPAAAVGLITLAIGWTIFSLKANAIDYQA
jgi:ABC-type polysaccharide/polyol phosphate export permease